MTSSSITRLHNSTHNTHMATRSRQRDRELEGTTEGGQGFGLEMAGYFCTSPTDQNLVTWSQPTAREAGKCGGARGSLVSIGRVYGLPHSGEPPLFLSQWEAQA